MSPWYFFVLFPLPPLLLGYSWESSLGYSDTLTHLTCESPDIAALRNAEQLSQLQVRFLEYWKQCTYVSDLSRALRSPLADLDADVVKLL